MRHFGKVVQQGTWRYAEDVSLSVRICESDIAYGTGDYEDSPEIRDDRQVRCFYIEYERAGSSGEYTGGGTFFSIAEAEQDVAAHTNGTVTWFCPATR